MRKRQFLETGTLKRNADAEKREMMEQIQQMQMDKLQKEREKKGLNDNADQDSQGDSEKEDPKEVQKQLKIMKAVRRREEWINHQVEELNDSTMHDRAFRKGIYRSANHKLHDFRGFNDPDRKAIAPFTMPKTPDNMQEKMSATKAGKM